MGTEMESYLPSYNHENQFWRFVLQDEPTLKVVFDNVRNYGIAASVVFAGRYWTNIAGLPSWPVWLLIGAGVCLVLLNALQSWALFLKTFYHFWGFTTAEMTLRDRKSRFSNSIKTALLLCILLFIPVGIWMFVSAVLRQVR